MNATIPIYGNYGAFKAAFSEKEIAELKSGQAWLTMTVGNYLTEPAKDHPKLAVENLVLKPEDARPVVVGQPGYFHGRVLFEDGSPAILDPEPWPGGQLSLSFPYAGQAELDKEGYFKVHFTPEQFEIAVAVPVDRKRIAVRPAHAEIPALALHHHTPGTSAIL